MYFRPLIGVTWGYCITPISNNRLRRPILLSSSPVYPPQIRTSLHLRWFQGFFLCNAVVLPRFLAVSWWCLVVVHAGSSEIHSMKIGLKILSWFKVAGWICVNWFLFFLFVEATWTEYRYVIYLLFWSTKQKQWLRGSNNVLEDKHESPVFTLVWPEW